MREKGAGRDCPAPPANHAQGRGAGCYHQKPLFQSLICLRTAPINGGGHRAIAPRLIALVRGGVYDDALHKSAGAERGEKATLLLHPFIDEDVIAGPRYHRSEI